MVKRLIYGAFISFMIITGLQVAPLSAEEDSSHFYYYILVDRFENGTTENDTDKIDRDSTAGFYGGDYQGIQKNIDHLKTIGVTEVILSPIVESEDYLGQQVKSFEQLQETYGSEEELKQLVDQLHEAGIDVLVHVPLQQVSATSDLVGRDWIQADGEIDFNNESAVEYISDRLNDWIEQFQFDGYYIENADQLPTESLDSLTNQVEGLWLGGMSNETTLENGVDIFDQVVRFGNHEETFSNFTGYEADFTSLLNQPLFQSNDVAHYIDFKHTDRFTRALEPTGNHPVTRWKLALTYLFTVPNDPIVFQGTEIPMDGSIDDLSTHKMINFLAGDDQVSRHVEKLSSMREEYESLRSGEMKILHDEDGFLAFERILDDEKVYVLINTTETSQHINLTDIESGKELQGLLINDLVREGDDGEYRIATDRESANIFVVKDNSGIYWPITLVFVGVMGAFIFFAITMYRKQRHKNI
ncbi:alpha-amylase family glycosyl hydrolase [Allobacillus sp. GCM10007491]|uniref:Glycosyl hydrolase family 13 catalytic domain-containing protein n=1 Tax=Allobacillus saliphilus TaxID=2912308 RepID=A0A941CYU8_9BACI|nr:alpha-amylase family glycosyl hydrolase [Allobacillus saliphilus]MBR7554595.1 hypothetical protein [Allobacillus saliphilus]